MLSAVDTFKKCSDLKKSKDIAKKWKDREDEFEKNGAVIPPWIMNYQNNSSSKNNWSRWNPFKIENWKRFFKRN